MWMLGNHKEHFQKRCKVYVVNAEVLRNLQKNPRTASAWGVIAGVGPEGGDRSTQ